MAWRISGSADLYKDHGRNPYNSINFITCHDGFTLRDLFSYNQKHNEANKEDNRDGTNDNHSCNNGVEGNTEDPVIIRARKQLVKNALCLLMFSAGTPMLLHGDEIYRTQHGNNNVWCQDDELSWLSWDNAAEHRDLLMFCEKAIAFRKQHPILEREKFFTGRGVSGDGINDISWFGKDLRPPDWSDPQPRLLCYQLDGREQPSRLGEYILFLILNTCACGHTVRLPFDEGFEWYRAVDTSRRPGRDFLLTGKEKILPDQGLYHCRPRCVVLLIGKKKFGNGFRVLP